MSIVGMRHKAADNIVIETKLIFDEKTLLQLNFYV